MRNWLLVTGILFGGFLALLVPLTLAEASAPLQSSPDGQTLFKQKCSSCHTIGGGKLVGPDLQGVLGRRDPAWLQQFISAPDRMFASGDPVAAQLLAENNNLPMPNLGLKEAQVQAILAYLENPQAAGQSPAQPAALPPGAALAGQKVFSGETRLANGGTACIACHSASGMSVLGGGSLGPDLTQVYRRLGEPGLAANLSNIVFPTMQGPFLNHPLTPQEQADLIAFFAWADGQAPDRNLSGMFFGAGALGAALLFGGMAFFWPRQRQSLSARLRAKPARTGRTPAQHR